MHMYMYSAEKEAWHILRVCAQACLTLCDPMDCSMPGLPVRTNSWSLLKLMSIESVMPSNHLIPLKTLSPPALTLSQHQGLY